MAVTMSETMTPGNRLYLYALLSEKLGVGKQVPIEQAEDVLRDDDVLPQDVGFETARAMLESGHFSGIARVDVFKKGRILLTMLPSAEMDEALRCAKGAEAAAEAEKAQRAAQAGKDGKTKAPKGASKAKAGKGAGGARSKSAGAKPTVKPSKPGKNRRRQEMKDARAAAEAQAKREEQERAEREAREAAERAAAEALAREAAKREAAEKAEALALEAAERARKEALEREAAMNARKAAAKRALDEQIARVTTPVSQQGRPGLRITYDPYEGAQGAPAADGPAEEAPQPAGPSLAEVVGRMISEAPAGSATVSRVARKRRQPEAAGFEPATRAAAASEGSPADTGQTAPGGGNRPGIAIEADGAGPAAEPLATSQVTAEGVGPGRAVDSAPGPSAGRRPTEPAAPALSETPAQAATDETVGDQDVSVTDAPAASGSPSAGQVAPKAAPASPAAPARPVRATAPADRQVPSAAVLADYPRSISRDVFCPTPLLSTLTRILPLTVDVTTLLDEDWAVARATGTVTGSRSRATFPLRYLREDGMHPVEVTLRRGMRQGATVRWEMALVDGDDGRGDVHQTASLEGLPLGDEGAWSDLGASALRGVPAASPIRSFAQFAVIGTWDAILGDLARTAAPERWAYPGTEIIPSSAGATRYPLLREYLAVTFQRVREQGKLAEAANGAFAAFNTGLATASLEEIYACFEPTGGDVPWRFAGFAQAGSGDLGRRITSELEHVPAAPTYIEKIDDVVPPPGASLVLDHRTILGDCLGRLPRGFLREALADMEGPSTMVDRMGDPGLSPAERAGVQTRLARFVTDTPMAHRRLARSVDDAAQTALAACRRSYRVAVPAYDPASRHMKLLLPLCLVNDRRADVALVVERQPSGVWQGVGLTTLPRAYACARVVSAEQPAWLAPEAVLG